MEDKKLWGKRCKCTKKCVVAESLIFDDYKTWLFDGKTTYREKILFQNKNHKMYTVHRYTIALNRDDDTNCVQADVVTREYLAW